MNPSESSEIVPVSIQRQGDSGIMITWNDGSTTTWTATQLRAACPCATCREKKRGEEQKAAAPAKPTMLPILSAAEAQPLRIESMSPVGSYAYNIAFSDGHSSGIFPFPSLKESSNEA